MKFNFDNFIGSSYTGIKNVHIMKEGSDTVYTESLSGSTLFGCQYHQIKWWAIIYRNGHQDLLVFLKNPKSLWSIEDWCKNHKFFKSVLELLKGE